MLPGGTGRRPGLRDAAGMVTWQVTVSSLVENVQRAMTELTAKYGIEQKVVASGMVTDAVIVRLKKPPNVEMTFSPIHQRPQLCRSRLERVR